ncbi:hypothetical protein Tco_0455145 [Tanacetum coccineum]
MMVKGRSYVYTYWIEKMESVQDKSGCRDNKKVKYAAGSFVGKALTWWNSQIHTRSREAAVGMAWSFKSLTREEFYQLDWQVDIVINEYRSSVIGKDWKHFKTLSLDGSRSPDFDLFSDQDEYSEEEVAETMEQYMSKTQADYGSRVARPKIEDKDNFNCTNKEGLYGDRIFGSLTSYGDSRINKSIPQKEKDPGSFTLPCYINNVCFDNALADLGASVSVMPLSTYPNLGLGKLAHTKLTVELADRIVKYPKGIAENVLVGIGKFVFPVDFIILDMPEDIKVFLILGRPFLSTAHAKIDVFKRKITLRVGEEKIIFKSVKPAKLNNVPLDLRRDQVDDLMPTIKEGERVEEFRARNNARMVSKFFGYPSGCDHDKNIRIDCAHNLKFSCMIDFAVLEDMDAYHDEGIGNVIFDEPFLRDVGINAKRFKGMITIYNGNEDVTYQMVRSHPRFNRHTNEQCNKIPPLLKVSQYGVFEFIDTDLTEKKSTMLVKYLQSANLEVLES